MSEELIQNLKLLAKASFIYNIRLWLFIISGCLLNWLIYAVMFTDINSCELPVMQAAHSASGIGAFIVMILYVFIVISSCPATSFATVYFLLAGPVLFFIMGHHSAKDRVIRLLFDHGLSKIIEYPFSIIAKKYNIEATTPIKLDMLDTFKQELPFYLKRKSNMPFLIRLMLSYLVKKFAIFDKISTIYEQLQNSDLSKPVTIQSISRQLSLSLEENFGKKKDSNLLILWILTLLLAISFKYIFL